MKRMLAFGSLMIGLLLVAADQAQGQKKDDPRKKDGNASSATPDDYKKLAAAKQVTGVIVSANSKTLTFRIDMPRVQPNVGKPGKGRPYPKLVHDYKEYEVDVADNVVVKKKFVNADYDNKGNFKVDEVAAKELRAKGFITSKIEDAKSGNIATIVLTPPKKADEVTGVGNVAKPTVKTLILEKEGTPLEPAKGPERKKKN